MEALRSELDDRGISLGEDLYANGMVWFVYRVFLRARVGV
jgi:hypothetical protein